jgi:hypothetical protein
LGWYNATVRFTQSKPFSGNALLVRLASQIQSRLESAGAEIAHLKMTLTPDQDAGDIGVVNLVRGDTSPFMAHSLDADLDSGELIVNLRAEGDPEQFQDIVNRALRDVVAEYELQMTVEHVEHFRPAKPVPTYRMAEA